MTFVEDFVYSHYFAVKPRRALQSVMFVTEIKIRALERFKYGGYI